MRFSSVAFGLPYLLIEQPRPQGAFAWLWRWGAREKRPGDEVVDWVILYWCACGADGRSLGRLVYGHVITRLQNSPYFWVFSHARTAKQTIWNEAENRERDWGETLKMRFFSSRLTGLALTPRFTDFFTDFEKKPDCFAVYVITKFSRMGRFT